MKKSKFCRFPKPNGKFLPLTPGAKIQIYLPNCMFFGLLIYFSFSCKKKDTSQENLNFGYSIDTVMIDSKERLLDLNGWILNSDLNHSESLFYLFNASNLSIDEIDLDRMEFVKSLSLEAEGSNGVGKFIFGLQILEDNTFFTKSFVLSTIINQNGHVLKRIDWDKANDLNGKKIEQFPRKTELITLSYGLNSFGLSYDFSNRKVYLDILSVQDSIIQRLDADPKNSFHDFFFKFDDNMNFLEPQVSLTLENKKVLLSHEFSNEVLVFDLQGNLEKLVEYEPKQTPKKAKIPDGPDLRSRDEIRKTYQQVLEQVRYEDLVWDKKNQRYFRLSSKRIFTTIFPNERSLLPEIKKNRVFVSIFDTNFNLMDELEVDELNDERIKYFAKDGKLWVAQNFNDELGFLVIDFEHLK